MILKNLLSLILCITFICSKSHAYEKMPGKKSQAIQVTKQQLDQIVENQMRMGNRIHTQSILLAENQDANKVIDQLANEKEKEEKENPKEDAEEYSKHFSAEDIPKNGDSRELALIIFAVVGLVMVVAWIPYFPLLAYEAVTGSKQHLFTHMISLQYSGLFNKHKKNDDIKVERVGHLIGGKYSFFIADGSSRRNAMMGASAEIGKFDLTDTEYAGDTFLHVSGNYWMIGPSIKFLSNKIDLMAGSSFNSKLGFVTKADFSFNFKIPKTNLSGGAGLGAIYAHINGNNGLLTEANDLGLIYTINIANSF